MRLLPRKGLTKPILKLSLPAIAGLSTQMVVSLVDAAIVGRLEESTVALAAMGIGVLLTWALVSFFSSFSTGTHVVVAQNYGRKNYEECGITLNNSMYFTFIIGVVVSFIAMYFASDIAHFIAKDPEVGDYASEFIFYRFMGIPFFLLTVSYRGFFFGISKTKIFMFSGIMVNLLNIIFNWILVYGKFGLPAMGVAGSGLGSTIATFVDFIYYFIISALPFYRSTFGHFKNFQINTSLIKQMLKISYPVSLQNVFVLLGFLTFMGIIGIIGTAEQAASQAVISCLFLSFLPSFGFGIGAATLVGNAIGSNKFKVARLLGFETAKLATYYTFGLGLIFVIFPEAVLIIITNDHSIIDMAVPALRIAGTAQVLYAYGVVLANGIQAAKKTLYVMMAEIISNIFIFVPAAYLFGIVFNWGIYGAWSALPLYIIFYTGIIFLKFKKYNW